MELPPVYSLASARAAGLTRGRLRGSGFVRLAHDLVARLDDAIDLAETLRLIALVLPPTPHSATGRRPRCSALRSTHRACTTSS